MAGAQTEFHRDRFRYHGAMSARDRLISSATALLFCALFVSLLESVFSSLVGVVPPAGYMALIVILTCVAALAVSPLALIPGASVSLSLAVFAAWVMGVRIDGWVAALAGVGIWVLASWGARAGVSAPFIGSSLGVVLSFSLLIWPRLARRAGLVDLDDGIAGLLLALGVLWVVFFAQLFVGALSRRRGWGAVGVLAILLPALTVLAPLLTLPGHPENRMPRYEEGAKAGEGASVLVLVLDTVRADHLSIYGYERETTPEMARLLEENPRAAVYDMAFAPGTWTLPSHASLFTGLLPSEHSAHEGIMYGQEGMVRRPRLTADETIAELAKRHDYRTAAVLANTVSLRAAGMRRGFDWVFKPLQERRFELLGEWIRRSTMPMAYDHVSKPGPSAYRVNELILRYIDSIGDAPFLVVGNYAEAHIPYAPRPPFEGTYTEPSIPDWGPPEYGQSEELMTYLEARYDEEILALDSALAELFEQLEARGVFDRTWVIVTSDHGEAFGEHGLTEHGTAVYNEVTRIPLIIIPPQGDELEATSEAVSLVDVTALISGVIGETKLGEGRDLREGDGQSVVRMEYFGNPIKLSGHGPLATQPGRAVAIGDRKLLTQGDRTELYLLSDDPLEEENRYEEMSDSVDLLTPELPDLIFSDTSQETRDFSEDEKSELQALGYLE